MQFIREFSDYLSHINRTAVTIVVGDINVDLLDFTSIATKYYQNCILAKGFNSYINIPTRETDNSRTCIDHTLVSIPSNLKSKIPINTYVYQSTITDHYTSIIKLGQIKNESCHQPKTYQVINQNKLRSILENVNWYSIEEIEDPNSATNKLTNLVENAIQKATEEKKITSKQRKIKPWMTNGILTSIRKRDKMKHHLLLNNTPQTLLEYKNYRNNLSKLINNVKNSFYREKIIESANNSRNTWKIINEMTNNNRKTAETQIKEIVDDNGNIHTDSTNIANTLNNYFTDIGTYLANQIPTEDMKFEKLNPNSLFIGPTTTVEISNIINSLKNKSSSGPDSISNTLIKQHIQFFTKPLTHIINLIFKTGVVPEHFRIAQIIPIYKSGSKQCCENYRPISLTNNFSKIFEKCFKKRLTDFIDKHQLISNRQFGFRNGLSTEDAITFLTDQIINNFNTNRKCLAVFLDLKKAFDTVSHNILLSKIERLGIRGRSFDIIKSFLYNRQQFTTIGTQNSKCREVRLGLPQGTVLAPVLFSLYINDILEMENIKNCSISSYADDTVVLFEGKNWTEAEYYANEGIKKLQIWLTQNKLTLNSYKTKYIAFSPTIVNQPLMPLNISLHDINCDTNKETKICTCNNIQQLQSVNNIKYLGVTIDRFLKWKDHILLIAKKIKITIPRFYELRNVANKKLILTVYNAMVESILNYAIIVWGSAYDNVLETVTIAQKSILKIIYRKERQYPTEMLFNETHILPVNLKYIYNCLKYYHKHKNNQKHITHSYETRGKSSNNLSIPPSSVSVHLSYHSGKGPRYYNLLPSEIRESQRQSTFNKKAQEFIQKNKDLFLRI